MIKISIAIIGGMAEVQILSLRDCTYLSDLSQHFLNEVFKRYGLYSKIHVIFYIYINGSLKSSERIRRQRTTDPIHYHFDGKTNIQNTNLKKLMSHTSTKEDISHYFLHNIIVSGNKHNKKVVSSFKNTVVSTK
ncbi:unnamed protein product [Psylliodes chrysocephalus]|uniref:Uncharacterized protein n=1 Tax=Psylliodes chrysocephalus TaxID=3402493 RepID=A0A9P0CI53_9CUCU|nr:unnamed protein product [Psylliodes chrysocephala]